MKKGEVLRPTSERRKKTNAFWHKVAEDFARGLEPKRIATKYKNPLTGRHYGEKHIYHILQAMKNAA